MEIIGITFMVLSGLFGVILIIHSIVEEVFSDFALGLGLLLLSFVLHHFIIVEKPLRNYEYHINVNMKGYTLYSSKGDSIGFAPYGNNKLDTLIFNDNQ